MKYEFEHEKCSILQYERYTVDKLKYNKNGIKMPNPSYYTSRFIYKSIHTAFSDSNFCQQTPKNFVVDT